MSKDTIYREDAIQALNECTDIKGFEYTQMHNALMEIPSADRPQGEWIDKGNWMGIECSRCKCHSRYVTPFCPQCGASMKGAEDE